MGYWDLIRDFGGVIMILRRSERIYSFCEGYRIVDVRAWRAVS
jgi:hypothetical protein